MSMQFKRLGKDSVVYGIGGMATRLIGFLLLPIYTRVFNPSDYGVMDVIATMTALVGIVLTAGTETALSYFFYRTDDKDDRRATVTSTVVYIVGVNAIVAFAVWLNATALSRWTFGVPGQQAYLRLAMLAVPFASLVGVHLNVLRLERRPWAYVVLSVSQLLFTVCATLLLVVQLRVGIIGVFWANLASAATFAVVGSVVNRAYLNTHGLSGRRLMELVRYGFPLIVGGLSMWAINSMDRYFLLRYTSLEQIGLYSVGLRLVSALGFLTWAFRTANAPFQFEISRQIDAREVYARTLTYFVLVCALVGVPLALFSRPALLLLTSDAYVGASRMVAIASASAVAYGAYQIVGVGLLLRGRTGYTGLAIGVGAVMNAGFLAILVPRAGIVGAAAGVLASHLVVVVLLYRGAQQAYPIPYELGRLFRILASATGIVAVNVVLGSQGWRSDAIVALVLYGVFVGLVWRLQILTEAERRAARNVLGRTFVLPLRRVLGRASTSEHSGGI